MSSTGQGLVVTVEVAGEHQLANSSAPSLQVERDGRVWPARIQSSRRDETNDTTKVDVEIPDFLPTDIDAWVAAGKPLTLRLPEGEWSARIVAAKRSAKIRPLTPRERAAQERWHTTQLKMQAAAALSSGAQFEREGGLLGERDRVLISCLLDPTSLQPAFVGLPGFCLLRSRGRGVEFSGDQEGGCFDAIRDSLDKIPRLKESITPCSELFVHGGELLPWGKLEARACDSLQVRTHLAELFSRYGFKEVVNPWPAYRERVFTRADLEEDGLEGDLYMVALEAFLYARKEVRTAGHRATPAVAKFDNSTDSVAPRKEPIEEGTGPIAEEAAIETAIAPSRDFTGASLGELKSTLVPTAASDAQIAALTAVVVEAQQTLPKDREAFVRDVNAILDAQHLRFSVNGGLARLALKNGSVQFSGSGFGTCGFRKHEATVVRVGQDYAVIGKRPRQASGSESSPCP